MKIVTLMEGVIVTGVLIVLVAVFYAKTCDAPSRQHANEIPQVRMADYERWAQAMLGHHEVRALCTGWDTNNDGYQSCDVLDTRTGRTYPLSCPFGLTMAQECKLRPMGTAP